MQCLSLHTKDSNTLFLLNVYSDDNSGAIKLLDRLADTLPLMTFMCGDFNCRSQIWDIFFPHNSHYVNLLVEVASCLGLSLASTPGVPTHFPFNRALNSSTIDLIFSSDNLPSPSVSVLPEERLSSDHAPMTADLPLLLPE
jgi:endonuclease/exonuclease/phosphatase family metal-dependent hydrolase